ncbi:MAG: hypothetical protein ABI175_00115 [Polyangiales bacterium]
MRAIAAIPFIAVTLLGTATAEVRVAASVHGSKRSYMSSLGDDPHQGFGPGLAVDFLTMRPHTDVAWGVHLAWHTWDEDSHNQSAHERYQLLQLHGYAEYRFSRGAVGVGAGIDEVFQRAYDVNGDYSYSNRHFAFGLDVKLALDVMQLRSGTLGLVIGFDLFPLIDVTEILSNGESDINWRLVSGSIGVSYRL